MHKLEQHLDQPLDLAWGAVAIGAEINKTPRETFHLLSTGALEGIAFKIGGQWVADRHLLRAKFRPGVAA